MNYNYNYIYQTYTDLRLLRIITIKITFQDIFTSIFTYSTMALENVCDKATSPTIEM